MTIAELIEKNRSYRRFKQSHRISEETLKELVGYARLSASGTNRQPLKFLIVHTEEDCARVFPHTAWAGYLKDWPGPEEGERPSAYIIILGDTDIANTYFVDHGIAAQSMLLGAVEKGLGGCMIASIKREALRETMRLPERYEILLITALGKPIEKVVIDPIKEGDYKYWRDENQVHHVPKRGLDELILRPSDF